MRTTAVKPTIDRELELHATPDRVWRAITDPTELSAWFGTAADLRPEAGYAGWVEWEGHGRFSVVVDAVEPGRYLSCSWGTAPGHPIGEGAARRIEWWVEPRPGGGTILRLRESGFDAVNDVDENTFGWLEELAELREHLADEPWQRPIRKNLSLNAGREAVWQALTDSTELAVWWGDLVDLEMAEGSEGWFEFPDYGRFAVRIVAVEAPRYLAWRWTADERDVPLANADQPLLVEWVLQDRAGGGTELHLMESGFTGPKKYADNTEGWTDEVLPALIRLVDGPRAAAS